MIGPVATRTDVVIGYSAALFIVVPKHGSLMVITKVVDAVCAGYRSTVPVTVTVWVPI